MNKARYDKASRRHTFIAVLGITVLAFLMLMSIASAMRDSDAWFNKGNALSNLNKFDETMKTYDKAIEINPHDSRALKAKETLSKQIE